MNRRMPRAASAGHTRIVVIGTLLLAIFLSIMPMPAGLLSYRPDWVALCLVYWSLEAPERVGMGTAWITGFAMDVLYGTLLGEQALADSVLAFITSGLRLRVRMFPRWQQALVVFALVGINHLIIQIAQHASGHPGGNWSYWTSDGIGALLWPLVYSVLRHLQRRTAPS